MTEFLEVFGLVLLAGLLAVIALIVFDAWHRRRHPEFGQRPAISAATEQMLHDHDSEMPTCVVDVKPPARERPMYAGTAHVGGRLSADMGQPPRAIEAGRSRS